MFFKDLIPYAKLDTFKEELLKQRTFVNVGVFTWIIGMLLMCIIFMSLMIVKVASTAEYYQNQTAALRTRNIQSYNPNSAADTTIPTILQIDGQEVQLRTELPTVHAVRTRTRPLRTPNHITIDGLEEMRAQLQQQQQQQLQQYQQQQQEQQQKLQQEQMQQQMQQQQANQQQQQQQYEQEEKLHASERAETSYLLERADFGAAAGGGGGAGANGEAAGSSNSMYEQPIYGTWRTKARRPQPPPFTGANGVGGGGGGGAYSMGDGKSSAIDSDYQPSAAHNGETPQQQQRQSLHLYEQLPRRASTMTPVRSDLRDQIPRPPRLTSRQPSMLLNRRQYPDIPINGSYRNEEKPKPFHFPHEGPLPHEFKKPEGERGDVNNIQEILQQLQLGGGPSKVPPLVMMPTGLHIAGTLKNFKSSGIANFFRGKRNKKQMQFAIPMPMPMNMQMLKPYPAHMMNLMPHVPYQQRIAMDQIYPFKPRSPNDINLLALQQQMQGGNRAKNKKKNKQKQTQPQPPANMMLQQFSNQRPYATHTDPYLANYQPLLELSEAQKAKMTRVPLKVNLDIYPVMPPSKDFKPTALGYDESKLASSTRRPHVVRNPFLEYYQVPVIPSTAGYGFNHAYEQPGYAPFRFPSTAQPPMQAHFAQPSNMHVAFPDQFQQRSQFQAPFMPFDPTHPNGAGGLSSGGAASSNPNRNEILVHLNLFPKSKQHALPAPTSNNPFYSNTQNTNRNIIMEERESLTPVEPRQQRSNSNTTNSPEQQISRSDSSDPEGLVDFEHPIVAADVTDLPEPAALVGNKPEAPTNSTYYDRIEGRSTFQHYNESSAEQAVDRMANEAHAASLFRFPVEDLIKFQVDDAL